MTKNLNTKRWIKKLIFILFISFFSWIAAFFIPPIQSPDENQHIARAYLLSRGSWNLQAPAGKMSGGYINESLEKYIHHYMELAGQPTKRLEPKSTLKINQARWSEQDKSIFFEMPGTGYYFPIIYAPHALALKIGEQLNMTVHNSYLLTRFLVIFSCISILMVACSIHQPNILAMAIFLLPMQIFQLLSPTLDGLTTSLFLLIMSLFFKSLQIWRNHQLIKITSTEKFIMATSIFIVVTSRIHLLPLIALPIFLAFKIKNKKLAYLHAIIFVFAALWLHYAIRHTVDLRIPRGHTTQELISHYFWHPLDFFTVLWRTLTSDLLVFYGKSFIGILGWLDSPLISVFYSTIIYGLLLIFLLGSAIKSDKNFILMNDRFILLLISISCILLAFLALLITWTPHPANVVAGIQGRYFVVPALLISYTMSNLFNIKSIKVAWLCLAGFGGLCVVATGMTLYARYWI